MFNQYTNRSPSEIVDDLVSTISNIRNANGGGVLRDNEQFTNKISDILRKYTTFDNFLNEYGNKLPHSIDLDCEFFVDTLTNTEVDYLEDLWYITPDSEKLAKDLFQDLLYYERLIDNDILSLDMNLPIKLMDVYSQYGSIYFFLRKHGYTIPNSLKSMCQDVEENTNQYDNIEEAVAAKDISDSMKLFENIFGLVFSRAVMSEPINYEVLKKSKYNYTKKIITKIIDAGKKYGLSGANLFKKYGYTNHIDILNVYYNIFYSSILQYPNIIIADTPVEEAEIANNISDEITKVKSNILNLILQDIKLQNKTSLEVTDEQLDRFIDRAFKKTHYDRICIYSVIYTVRECYGGNLQTFLLQHNHNYVFKNGDIDWLFDMKIKFNNFKIKYGTDFLAGSLNVGITDWDSL